jgi:uncharacterized protein YggE
MSAIVRRAAWAALAAVSLLAAPALADSDFPAAILVTGEASISLPPDVAHIDAGVASDAKTAREASDANNAAMGKVLAALKTLGIDEKDYQTSRLSLQPQYAPNRPGFSASGPSAIVGYRASNRVTIKLRDVTKVAGVIDTLVAAGANDIGNIGFSLSQASKLLDDARDKALADARRKAEIYAKSAGVTLGAPLSISEGGAPAPVFRSKMAMPMATSTPIAQGEETLSVSVSVTWAIKPAQ